MEDLMRRIERVLGGAVLVLAWLPASVLLADVTPEPEFGESLSPRTPTNVAMVEETVNVLLGREFAEVMATFTLKNTGKAVTLRVGFPDVAVPKSTTSGKPPEGLSAYSLRDFTATVEGGVVKHAYEYPRRNGSPFGALELSKQIGKIREEIRRSRNEKLRAMLRDRIAQLEKKWSRYTYRGWLVWEMTFGSGQTRRVEVKYRVPYRPPYTATLLGAGTFEYILRTGAPWKGPIKKAVIAVQLEKLLGRKNVLNIAPKGYKWRENTIKWTFTNLEPEQDIAITLNRYADFASAAGAYLELHEEHQKAGNASLAASDLARASECQQKADLLVDCIQTCRRIIAFENRARKTGSRGRYGQTEYVRKNWKDPYEPWECRIVNCYLGLGKKDKAAEEARGALAALEALLKLDKSGTLFQRKAILKLLAVYKKIASRAPTKREEPPAEK